MIVVIPEGKIDNGRITRIGDFEKDYAEAVDLIRHGPFGWRIHLGEWAWAGLGWSQAWRLFVLFGRAPGPEEVYITKR